jgi:hypothetical protein
LEDELRRNNARLSRNPKPAKSRLHTFLGLACLLALFLSSACNTYDKTNKLGEITYRVSAKWDSMQEDSRDVFFTREGLAIHIMSLEGMLAQNLAEITMAALASPDIIALNDAATVLEEEIPIFDKETFAKRVYLSGYSGNGKREAVVFAFKTGKHAYAFIFAQNGVITDENMKHIDAVINSIRMPE